MKEMKKQEKQLSLLQNEAAIKEAAKIVVRPMTSGAANGPNRVKKPLTGGPSNETEKLKHQKRDL